MSCCKIERWMHQARAELAAEAAANSWKNSFQVVGGIRVIIKSDPTSAVNRKASALCAFHPLKAVRP